MKLLTLLPLAALTTAFVIPDDEVLNQIQIETEDRSTSWFDKLPSTSDIVSSVEETAKSSYATAENALDAAFDRAFGVAEKASSLFQCTKSMVAFDMQSWLETATVEPFEGPDGVEPHHPHRRPHRRPHHPHHHKPNLTVYDIINKSKYTTKFAKLINEYDDLVEILNATTTNYTVFAPTDKAFEKLPKHHPKPDKQLIKNILAYHFSPDFYPVGRVLVSHTIPTAYREQALGGEPQRLRLGLSLRGLTVNFYSRVIGANFFATNGVVHGIDTLLFPPPSILKIISLLPGEFSTTELALVSTGMPQHADGYPHTGATFFAPTNWAWQKLGPRVNAFLFSSHGEKYLKALLKYHIVANQTLYSDAFYGPKKDDLEEDNIPKGVFHAELPTLLKDHKLSIDVARWGGLINIRINGYTEVSIQDGIAQDGVIQVPRSVLIPPKHPHCVAYQGEDLTVEDLVERLEPYVDEAEENVVEKTKAWFDL